MDRNPRQERSHYVPQFYLRQWCDDDGKLWAHPIDGSASFRSKPGSVAVEKGLYDSSMIVGMKDWDTERTLSGLEGIFSSVWPGIFERIHEAPDTKWILAQYLAITHLRHPYQKGKIRGINQMYRDIVEDLQGQHDEVEFIHGDQKVKVPIDEIREHASDTDENINRAFIRFLRQSTEDLADVFIQRKWGVFVADYPAFVTGDCPLVRWKGDSTKERFGFATPGTQITFPLSPYKLLMIQDGFEEDGMLYPLESLGNLNQGVRAASKRFVFSLTESIPNA